MDRSEFLRIVKEQLPDLRQSISEEQGLLHFEMDVLWRFAQQAIFDKELYTVFHFEGMGVANPFA